MPVYLEGGNFMKKILHSQKGLTLIEILASIVILSIVVITFFTFFINSSGYTSISSEKFQTTNLAREVSNEFKVNADVKNDLKNVIDQYNNNKSLTSISKNSFPAQYLSQDIIIQSGVLQLYVSKPDYTVLVLVNPSPESGLSTSLYKLHIEIMKNGKLLNETFTYAEY